MPRLLRRATLGLVQPSFIYSIFIQPNQVPRASTTWSALSIKNAIRRIMAKEGGVEAGAGTELKGVNVSLLLTRSTFSSNDAHKHLTLRVFDSAGRYCGGYHIFEDPNLKATFRTASQEAKKIWHYKNIETESKQPL